MYKNGNTCTRHQHQHHNNNNTITGNRPITGTGTESSTSNVRATSVGNVVRACVRVVWGRCKGKHHTINTAVRRAAAAAAAVCHVISCFLMLRSGNTIIRNRTDQTHDMEQNIDQSIAYSIHTYIQNSQPASHHRHRQLSSSSASSFFILPSGQCLTIELNQHSTCRHQDTPRHAAAAVASSSSFLPARHHRRRRRPPCKKYKRGRAWKKAWHAKVRAINTTGRYVYTTPLHVPQQYHVHNIPQQNKM